MIIRDLSDDMRLKLKRPVLPLLLLLGVIITGTIGYSFIWENTESTLIDELYMTFITITTIGYEEIYPLDTFGRIFTIFIGVSGIGTLFYILGVLMENLVIMQLSNYRRRKKIMRKLIKMKNHIIVVGYGRVGKLASKVLMERGESFLVINNDFSNADKDAENNDILFLEGDATDDDILTKAGIDTARGMIVTTANSATTVFVVLSAKVLNPNLFIVARSDDDHSDRKLKLAGADRVENPYEMGGQRLANLIINKNIVDFIETSFISGKNDLTIETIILPETCPWLGKSLREINFRNRFGVTILAIIRENEPVMNPPADYPVKQDDRLVVFGKKDDLKKLESSAFSN
jgi:voltage-gated potassium channel